MKVFSIEEYFLVCRDVQDYLDNKNIVMNYKYDFKKFVNYCYRNALFKYMDDCVYKLADLYNYLASIELINCESIISVKLDCILNVMNLYKDNSLESFSRIMKSDSFLKIILFKTSNSMKIDKINRMIVEFESYKHKYNVYEFSDLVFNAFISSEHKYLTFNEILRQDKLNLKSVEALANLKTRDYEDLILLKVVNEAGLKFELETVDGLYRNIKMLGESKQEACEIFAERNDITLNREFFHDENFVESVFEVFFKDYIVVSAFNKLWGCKML